MLLQGSALGKPYPILQCILLFSFIRCPINHFPTLDIKNYRKQKDRSCDAPKGIECLIQTIFPAVCTEPAQHHGGQDLAFLDRDGDPQLVLPMGLDEFPSLANTSVTWSPYQKCVRSTLLEGSLQLHSFLFPFQFPQHVCIALSCDKSVGMLSS